MYGYGVARVRFGLSNPPCVPGHACAAPMSVFPRRVVEWRCQQGVSSCKEPDGARTRPRQRVGKVACRNHHCRPFDRSFTVPADSQTGIPAPPRSVATMSPRTLARRLAWIRASRHRKVRRGKCSKSEEPHSGCSHFAGSYCGSRRFAEDEAFQLPGTVFQPHEETRETAAGRSLRAARLRCQSHSHFARRRFGTDACPLQAGRDDLRRDRAPTLVTESRETALSPGMCAGFPARGEAHHVVNRSDEDAVILEIGDRTKSDAVRYPRDNLQAVPDDEGKWRFVHKDGSPYEGS